MNDHLSNLIFKKDLGEMTGRKIDLSSRFEHNAFRLITRFGGLSYIAFRSCLKSPK